MEEIVTGDETWIYHFQPDSKAKNKVWVSSEGNRPVTARRCKTSFLILLWYCIGSAVYQCLQHIPKEDYRAAFWKWVDRCKMCVEADGHISKVLDI